MIQSMWIDQERADYLSFINASVCIVSFGAILLRLNAHATGSACIYARPTPCDDEKWVIYSSRSPTYF